MNSIVKTDFKFTNQVSKYSGKVRDVYNINNELLVMVASDRLSAFDIVLPRGIPFKGQILNQIASKMLNATSHIIPNWLQSTPDPNVSIGSICEPFKIEMVIRGYLAGHAARLYNSGKRLICGIKMPDGMIENDKFPYPIITPTTKALDGSHDEDISKDDILKTNIVSKEDYLN
jgi:phosphoribosylaminoimidazole-succinocarboxamide synthase